MIRVIVTSSFGLEAVVKRELQALGYDGFLVADGKIEFDAELKDIPRLNINLRVADRVLIKVGEYPATDFGVLFDRARELPWEDWITSEGKITVIGKCVRSQLASVRSCQSIIKKAIVERLKEKFLLETLPEIGPEYTIQVALLKDVVQLTLDTSGNGLHKRGYRLMNGDAPLRENLAAALVLLSFWNRDRLLIDPMCGSGTILIEAAMIARNMAPGLNREFAAEQWPALDSEYWRQARLDAGAAVVSDGELKIFGYDIDEQRIKDCLVNAKKAGVAKDISFAVKDIKELWIDKPSGIIIMNPPYGIHLGSEKEMTPIYVSIHNTFKKKTGWSLFVLTADKRFPDFFKRAAPDRVRKLFNGTIEVNYYQYHGERPDVILRPKAEESQ
ncbi:MAG: class I SAM-dependent RNA methyltransferase [Candidatus Omnitrophica bacterium]|nr:class I SAM-dependent RNA methyltransferase [Candidatus Omnitrophota bacterium]